MSTIERDMKFIRKMIYQFYQNNDPNAITRIVSRYGMDYDDVMQVACIAYLKAEDKYDESKDVKFVSFVGYVVKGDLRDMTRMANMKKRKTADEKLISIHHENEEGDPIAEVLPSKNDEVKYLENKLMVEHLLDQLEPDEKFCLVQYYYHGYNQREIGKQLGIAQKNVSRKINSSIEKLKELVQ